ncbi:MAG: hydrolase [Ketobacteraceae bacterium]|nr:hydrolase [Ketobacteraceae bacterium]
MTSKSPSQKPMHFKPARFLKSRHAQTMWAPLVRQRPRIERWRERITLSDGDFVDLDWAGPTRGPIVMIFHGLTGSSESPYAIGLQAALKKQGIRSFVMHFRGCSGEPNLRPRLYHSGETEDLEEVYQLIRARHPNTPLFGVGYSLGGNVLLKWLGESNESPELDGAVAVSVPYNLGTTSVALDKGFSRIYRDRMMNELKWLMTRKKQLFQRHNPDYHSVYDSLGDFKKHITFSEFDEYVIAPLHGFTSARDYYEKSSSKQFLKNIRVPTLLIHSKDDPFMTEDTAPSPEEISDHVSLELYQHGGHVGFIGGSVFRPRYWLEHRIPLFIQAHLTRNKAGHPPGAT